MCGLEEALAQAGLVDKYRGGDGTAVAEMPCSSEAARNSQPSSGASMDGVGRDLHGQPAPNFTIQRENPEHRFLLYLFAQGNSIIEVFKQLGGEVDVKGRPVPGTGKWSYHWLAQIRRQSWFRTQLTQFLHEMGKDVVQAKLQTELLPSLEAVIEIRDDRDAPSATRLNAANSLIDRFLGKPVQRVVQENNKTLERFEEDASVLTKQIEQIEFEMKSLNQAAGAMLEQLETKDNETR